MLYEFYFVSKAGILYREKMKDIQELTKWTEKAKKIELVFASFINKKRHVCSSRL